MSTAERLAELAAVEAAVWQELARAATDRTHEWRTPVLATVDGNLPDARTVVLREVDAGARQLVLYSDARAAKIGQLAAQPRAVLLAWSPRLRWQLRLRIEVEVHTGGLAVASRWARLKLAPSAADYLSALAPGAPLQAPGSLPPAEARAHFALLQAAVRSIDWLELHPDGHRRAAFDADGARWLQP